MKLIDKGAVVAEIERYKHKADERLKIKGRTLAEDCKDSALQNLCGNLLHFIDTLEVKEVDIEDSIKETLAQKYVDYIFKRHNIDPESKEGQLIYYAYMHGMNQRLTQLRTQKGE